MLEIGKKYHVYGFNFRAYFVLLALEGDMAVLGYPKNTQRQPIRVKADKLHTLKQRVKK